MFNAKYAVERRKELNLSQTQLAGLTGIAAQLISKYERNKVTPGRKNLRLLAEGLKTTKEELWIEETVPTNHVA